MSVWADLVPALIAMLSAPLAAGVTYWATRKKRQAEQQLSIAETSYKSVQAMQSIVDETRSEVSTLRQQNDQLQSQVDRLQRQSKIANFLGR